MGTDHYSQYPPASLCPERARRRSAHRSPVPCPPEVTVDARRAPDWQAVLGVLAGVASVEDLDSFGPRVLVELAEVIAYTVGSFNELDPLAHRARFDSHPPEAKSQNEAAAAAFPRLAHQHPVAMYQQRTGDGSARRLSDFLDQDALH